MKCICGYVHESGINDNGEWKDNLVGDEKFYLILGHFRRDSSYRYEDSVKVNLYICPKCCTVRSGD